MNIFRLETAIDKAVEEYLTLDKEEQTPINVMLLARKYAPVTMKQCLDVMSENLWLFVLDAKPGNKVLDVFIATVESYISASIEFKVGKLKQEQLMEDARRQTLRQKLTS